MIAVIQGHYSTLCDEVPSLSRTVRVATTDREINQLRHYWMSWCRHPSCDMDYFLSETKLHTFVVRPYVIVVERDGRPDCLLLGRLVEERLPLSVGATKIHLARVRLIKFLREGFLGNQSPENCGLLLEALLQQLAAGEADAVELRNIPLESGLYREVTHRPSWLCRDFFPSKSPHYGITVADSVQQFSARLPRKTRQHLARQSRRIEREFAGQVHIRCITREEELDDLLETVKRISRNTYQGDLGTGFSDTAAIREELAFDLRKRRLRAYLLYSGGVPCAFLIGKVFKENYYVRFMGYEPAFSAYSPGLLLLQHVVFDLIAMKAILGVQTIDLGSGDLRYKRSIADRRWEEATVYIFAPSARAFAVKMFKTAILAVYESAKYAVDKSGHRDALVRNWRRVLVRYKKATRAGDSNFADPETDC